MIAIIGTNGFIGKALAERFLEKGVQVISIPSSSHGPVSLDGDCKWLAWMLNGVDTVYLCAGRTGGVGRMKNDPLSFVLPNVRIVMNVFEAAQAAGVRRVVCSQSITGYPDTPEPVKEDQYHEDPLHPAYFVPGNTWRFVDHLSKMFDMEFVFVRPSNVYGPGNDFDPQTSHVIEATIRKIYERQDPMVIWGNGEETRDPTYIDDLAEAMTMCGDCEPGAYNIGTGQSVSVNDIIKILCDYTDFHPELIYDETKPSAIATRYLNCDKVATIGWKPDVSIEEGLQATYDWYVEAME